MISIQGEQVFHALTNKPDFIFYPEIFKGREAVYLNPVLNISFGITTRSWDSKGSVNAYDLSITIGEKTLSWPYPVEDKEILEKDVNTLQEKLEAMGRSHNGT